MLITFGTPIEPGAQALLLPSPLNAPVQIYTVKYIEVVTKSAFFPNCHDGLFHFLIYNITSEFLFIFENLFVNYIEFGACDDAVTENGEESVKMFVSFLTSVQSLYIKVV